MKRIFSVVMFAAIALTSCHTDVYHYTNLEPGYGILSFANADITVSEEVETRAGTDNYCIWVLDSEGKEIDLDKTSENTYIQYSNIVSSGIKLPAGDYTLVAQSQSKIPTSEFEAPVYGAEKSFSITAGEETIIEETIICKLWKQVKTTVEYNEFFLEHLNGAGKATVTINNENPLVYNVVGNATSNPESQEKRAGYFDLSEYAATEVISLEIEFEGPMLVKEEGSTEYTQKNQKMRYAISGIKAGQWRQLKFNMEEDKDGNAAFTITIDDMVVDLPLVEDVVAGEDDSLGDDPNKPKGDGGIKLLWTAGSTDDARKEWNSYNTVSTDENTGRDYINKPSIVINALEELVFTAEIPNNIGEQGIFTVDITSDNASFENAVEMVSPTRHIDLINDVATVEGLGQFEINFPSGEEVTSDSTDDDNIKRLTFNLSEAVGILTSVPYVGTHTFTMSIQDATGCSNIIALNLTIEE